MAPSNWSDLPSDILAMIVERSGLIEEMSISRLRAVCSSWRHSLGYLTDKYPRFLIETPYITEAFFNATVGRKLPSFLLAKVKVFVLFPPKASNIDNMTPWIMYVEHTAPNKCLLLNFTSDRFENYFLDYQINLLNYDIIEVSSSYNPSIASSDYVCQADGRDLDRVWEMLLKFEDVEKVIGLGEGDIPLLALCGHRENSLAIWRYGDKYWTLLEKEQHQYYVDIIRYCGEFYALETDGMLMRIDLPRCALVNVVTDKVPETLRCPSILKLVEFDGQLYLVNYKLPTSDWGVTETSLRVFVLNNENRSWDRVYNLGGGVFFVRKDCIFSVLAKVIGMPEGNVVYFYGYSACVLVLNVSDSTPTKSFWPDCEPFWPPPSWIKEVESSIPQRQNQELSPCGLSS